MLSFAVVGYDHAHLPRYVPALAAHPGLSLDALVAPGANRALAKNDAAKYEAAYFESVDDFCRGKNVDAAYIGSPPNQHLAIVEKLAPKGIHLLCDKPIAISLDDADAIIECCNKHKVKLMVPFNPRYQFPVQKLKAMIDNGELGELQHLHATKYGKVPRGIPNLDTEWFFDPKQAGFGGFGDIGIHAVDALRWLAGSEAKSVYATVDRLIDTDMAVDDMGTMIIEFENGVVASQQSGWVNPAGNNTWLSVGFEALGTGGAASIDKPYHDLEISDGNKSERLPWWRADIPMLIDEFVNSVVEDRQPAITGADARAALAILHAAYQSAESGQAVTLRR